MPLELTLIALWRSYLCTLVLFCTAFPHPCPSLQLPATSPPSCFLTFFSPPLSQVPTDLLRLSCHSSVDPMELMYQPINADVALTLRGVAVADLMALCGGELAGGCCMRVKGKLQEQGVGQGLLGGKGEVKS